MTDWRWQIDERYACVSWPGERLCLSSAPLNGGLVSANRVLNLRVAVEPADSALQPPEQSLSEFAALNSWEGTTVGLMTAASMNSLRSCQRVVNGIHFELVVSCGLSNARRAGDSFDWQASGQEYAVAPPAGTINLVLLSSAILRPEAMAELLMITTEARCIALQELGVRSPVSGLLATGTGTDASVIVSGAAASHRTQTAVRWCGKHTAIGETVAKMVIDALRQSIQRRGDAVASV